MEQENVQGTATAEDAEVKKGTDTAENVEEKKYTDKQLNDISMRNEQKAINKLLKELGIEDKEEAKAVLADYKAKKVADMNESEKNDEIVKAKEKAQIEAINAKIENAMLRKGIKDSRVERAVRLIDKTNILDETGSLDSSKLNTELEDLLKEFPELIEKKEEEKIGFKIGADGKQDKPEDEFDKMKRIMGIK